MEDRPLDEAELVERARRGDVRAYERIVGLYQGIAFRTAWTITRSAADAEEAAQDAFLKAYRALARFRQGSSFRPWLLAIVANEARNRRTAAGRRERLVLRAAEAADPPGQRRPGGRGPASRGGAARAGASWRAAGGPRSPGGARPPGDCLPLLP